MLGYIRQQILYTISELVGIFITAGTWIKYWTKFSMFKRVVFTEPALAASNTKATNERDGNFTPVIDGKIQIHPDTNQPTRAWEKLKVKQNFQKIKKLSQKTPINPKKVRFVCISDTHNKNVYESIPDGDVLIHAGDFSMVGHPSQIEEFNDFLGTVISNAGITQMSKTNCVNNKTIKYLY
jgi:hypothetical protein